MPHICVLAGPSPSSLHPIQANTAARFKVKTSTYEGELSVYLKNFIDEHGVPSVKTEYFEHPERQGRTWSIQARGRFLNEVSGDNVMFGNVFDRPLHLPYGSSAALGFVKLQDSTLEHDLQGDKPWALSPYLATMPFLSHTKISPEEDPPSIASNIIIEDAGGLIPNSTAPMQPNRRKYFSSLEHRRSVKLGPSDFIQTDFCHGHLSFDNNSLAVDLPIGLSLNLMKYWHGGRAIFACCKRRDDGHDGPGEIFWCMAFELKEDGDEVEEDAIEDISRDIN
ncbi:hypothetical protein BS47DRAFT_1320831 [Hydnum rufescens UP504]|uniref:Domain of unknown function at the cortex 1 domain-containing protein n=1 Tax=Hydnum rufescens UP504 TaxID=1448309 RepID=A0A9P6ALU6_9AGAM|nr:hypothetical protein BS47DRAFT_1320831 [Hydnum rufescens UP504]